MNAAGEGRDPLEGTTDSETVRRVEQLELLFNRLARLVQDEKALADEERERAQVERDANSQAFAQITRALTPPAAPQEAAGDSAGLPGPVPWTERATAQQWHDLAAWVDWLSETYELLGDLRIVPCWPAHLGVVEELAALWDAWRAAAGRAPIEGEPPGDNDALAFWHDRYLAPLVNRLPALYSVKSCRHGHSAPGRAPSTDRDLLPPLS